MFDTQRPYAIHWELTDLCNLKCPMCPRTDHHDHCRPVETVQGRQFNLKDVKRYLPGRFLEKVGSIDFCGNFGDPCMARDFYAICRFLIEKHVITLTVSTNGSMRRPDWWQKLGRLFASTPGRVEFHIDGLADTNHQYRIGARWPKIMANAAAFIMGGGRADWLYIVFKHNQHQVAQACELAGRMGFHRFVTVDSGRFPDHGKFVFMHPDGGMCHLEPADADNHGKAVRTEENRSGTTAADLQSTREGRRASAGSSTIKCKSAKHNRFYLDAAGYLAPCCWVSHHDPGKPGNMLKAVSAAGRGLEEFNIFRRPIVDIVQDNLFAAVFPGLWRLDILETCRKKCGRGHRNIRSGVCLRPTRAHSGMNRVTDG